MYYLRPKGDRDGEVEGKIESQNLIQKNFYLDNSPFSILSWLIDRFIYVLIYDIGFESLGSTMYLATLMLTGQGGPDDNDLPWYTKAVVLLTGVFSIGMVRFRVYIRFCVLRLVLQI